MDQTIKSQIVTVYSVKILHVTFINSYNEQDEKLIYKV